MKKRPKLALEQLEARETPDVSLGRSAALSGPLPIQAPSDAQGQHLQGPALPDAPGASRQDGLTKVALHPQALESLFLDRQSLDALLAQSLEPQAQAASVTEADSQQTDVSEFRAIEDATRGWNFFSNYTRKAIRNEELRYGRLHNHDDLLNQVYVEWRTQVGSHDLSLAHLLDKNSGERQALRKAVRRTLDHERYDQRRQQKFVELFDQPAPDKPTEQDWTDLQLDWSGGVANLTPGERQTLELRHQGMTFEEIGAVTGLPKQRVFEIFNAALDRLQEVYSS